MLNILLVEDEISVGNLINKGLSERGYTISLAPDGNIGYEMASRSEFDLIILDIMLPAMNGLELCRRLRNNKMAVPILMLTALGSTENIVTGLDSGADDYLTKPFKFAELEARIRSLARRKIPNQVPDNHVLRIADLELDPDSKQVSRTGKKINLTSTEFRLLEYLMKNKGRVLSRMTILENVWGIDFNISTNVVDVYINYIRKKIENNTDQKLLHTIVGKVTLLRSINMRIQTKTGILFTVITATLILVISTTSYFITSKFVSRDFHKRLELRVIVATKVLFEQEHTSAIAYADLRKRYLEALPQEKEYVFPADTLEILRKSHAKLAIPYDFLKEIQKKNGETVYYFNGSVDYAGLLHKGDTGEFLVIKSAVNEYGINTLMNLRNIKIATFILGVIIVYTASIFFAKKTFQPVREIINKSKNISVYNLGLRLEETQGGDEIGELAKTFNTMLDRLQTAFETQNNFISNASHELRTPLTNIIGEADWALSKERTTAEYQQSIQVIQQHADKLNKITSDLLTLAQSSFNGKQQEWEDMGILELIEESAFSIRNLIRGTAIEINISHQQLENSDLTLSGNKTLLKLALGNIIANGAKYSNQKNVAIGVEVWNNTVKIRITDEGIGIPEKEISKIFEPFFRASNTGPFEGYGVGLPLAMNIIRIHNGNIEVESNIHIGTTVTVTLPINPVSSTNLIPL